MISASYDGTGLEKLLEDKSLNAEQRRRIVATGIALKLIAAAVTSNQSTYKLSDEMQNLPRYVDLIEAGLASAKK